MLNIKRFLHIFYLEVFEGIFKELWRFAPIVIVILYSSLKLYTYQDKIGSLVLTMEELIFWQSKGMPEVYNLKEKFFVPDILWISFHIYLAYLNSVLVTSETKNYNYLLHKEKRIIEWFSKCIKCCMCVFVYYLVAYLMLWYIWSFIGSDENELNQLTLGQLLGIQLTNFYKGEIIMICIVLQFIVSLAISIFQLMISVLTNRILGILSVVVILVSSIFINNSIFVGNYLMAQRNPIFVNGDIGYTVEGVIYTIVIAVVSVIVGGIKFNRKDIY